MLKQFESEMGGHIKRKRFFDINATVFTVGTLLIIGLFPLPAESKVTQLQPKTSTLVFKDEPFSWDPVEGVKKDYCCYFVVLNDSDVSCQLLGSPTVRLSTKRAEYHVEEARYLQFQKTDMLCTKTSPVSTQLNCISNGVRTGLSLDPSPVSWYADCLTTFKGLEIGPPPNSFLEDLLQKNLKKLLSYGLGTVPIAGGALKSMMDTFWDVTTDNNSEKKNVWDEIREKVKNEIDTESYNIVNSLLTGKLKRYRQRLEQVEEDNKKATKARDHFMQVARDLIGLEQEFSEFKLNNAYKTLSIYSTILLMKVTFYKIGLTCGTKYALTDDDQVDISTYLNKTIIEAKRHYNDIYKRKKTDILLNAEGVADLTKEFITFQNFMTINALEYIDIFDNFVNNSQSRVNNILFSNLHGTVSLNTLDHFVREGYKDPLYPAVVGDRRAKLSSVKIFYNNHMGYQDRSVIAGVVIEFENGDSFHYGNPISNIQYFRYAGEVKLAKDEYILSMEVTSSERQIEKMQFVLSSKKTQVFGESKDAKITTKFAMNGYHIGSLDIATDTRFFNEIPSAIVNIMVSYERDDDFYAKNKQSVEC